MGSTGYPNTTAAEAKDAEFMGMQILKRKGNWVIARRRAHVMEAPGRYYHVMEAPGLYYQKTWKYRDECVVKTMHICEGPAYGNPPKAIAKAYLAWYGGDYEAAGGEYGAPLLREAIEGKPAPKLKKGDVIVLHSDLNWSSGLPIEGTYTYLGGFRLRNGAGLYRLPRNWRKAWDWEFYAPENLTIV